MCHARHPRVYHIVRRRRRRATESHVDVPSRDLLARAASARVSVMTNRILPPAAAILLLVAACRHDSDGLPLLAAGDDARLGTVSATWQATEEERGFANAARLDEPEVRFRYRVDAHNRADEKLFVRLDRFELVDASGLTVASADRSVECTLGPGMTEGALAGDVWVRRRDTERVKDFRIRRFAAALGDAGRARYRAWLLQGRPGDEAAVEQEIARQAAAPPCAG
jgi:hypothetical protein